MSYFAVTVWSEHSQQEHQILPLMTICDLQPGIEYEVLALITDFHGGVFQPGQRLTFVESHFLPYDNGHTVIFSEIRQAPNHKPKELRMYLQGNDHRDIIEQTDKYLRSCLSKYK